MARIVKDADIRQNEILDTAQMLFYSKGYEKTAVRDIIDEVGIAKGTFYHHFNSKAELLDALIMRLLEQSMLILEPILASDQLTALEKLHSFFNQAGNLKIENETFLRSLLPIWYQDGNAIMREKTKHISFNKLTPMFNQIIQQGINENVFYVLYPEEIGSIVLQMMFAMSDMLTQLLMDKENKTPWAIVFRKTEAYNTAIDSLLGTEPGSLHLFKLEQFQHWFEEAYNDN